MNTAGKPYNRFDTFLLIIAILGIVLSILTLRTALLQDDDFRVFTSVVWIAVLFIYVFRHLFRLKCNAP